MILSNNTISGTINSEDELIINSGTQNNQIITSGKLTINDINMSTTENAIVGNGAIIDIIGGTISSSKVAVNCLAEPCTTTIGIKGDVDEHGDQIVSKTNPSITGNTFVYLPTTAEAKVFFYDGILTGQFNAGFDEIEENYDLINPENTQTRYLDKIAVMRNNETNVPYYNIQKAINEASNGDTLVLLRNYNRIDTVPTFIVEEGKDIIINLNGFDIVGGKVFINNGSLAITNIPFGAELGAIDNNGTLNISGSNIDFNILIGTVINNSSTGTVNLNGVTFKVPEGGDADPMIDCSTYPVPIVNDGTLNLSNSVMNSGLGCQLIDNNNIMSINGTQIKQEFGNRYYHWKDYGSNKVKPSNMTNEGISASLITNDGELTINSGTFIRRADKESTTTVEKLYENFDFNHQLIYSNGTIRINGGTFIVPNDLFLTSIGTAEVTGANITNDKDVFVYSGELSVTEATVNTDSAIFNAIEDSNLYINGGNYTTSGKRVYELYVDSRTYYNPYTYYSPLSIQKGGNVEVNGGVFTNNGTSNQAVFYGNGSATATFTMKKGSLNAPNSGSILLSLSEVTLGIKGDKNENDEYNISNDSVVLTGTTNIIKNVNNKINFYDGKLISTGDALPIASYIYSRITNTEEGYSIIGSDNMLYVGKTNVVKNLSTNIPYENVQEAVNETNTGDTLQFISDVFMTSKLNIPSEKTLIFDLNSKSIQQYVDNYGNLTIIDSGRSDGNGSYDITDSYKGYIEVINNYGTLNVESGRVELISNKITANKATINKAYVYDTWNYGDMEVNAASYDYFYNYEGEVTFNGTSINQLFNERNSNITIESGTIKTLNNNLGKTTINNGTFIGNGENYSINNSDTIEINNINLTASYGIDNKKTLTINGGTLASTATLINNNIEGSIVINNTDINTIGRLFNKGIMTLNNSSYINTRSYGTNCENKNNREQCESKGTINLNNSSVRDINTINFNSSNNSTINYVNSRIVNIDSSTISTLTSNYSLSGTISNSSIGNIPVEVSYLDLTGNTINGGISNVGILKNNTFNGPLENSCSNCILENNIMNNTSIIKGGTVTLSNNTMNGTLKINATDAIILSGTVNTTSEFGIEVSNYSTLTLGVDDENISKESPSIKGQKGILLNNNSILNFYDGIVISDLDKDTIIGTVITPTGYVVNVVNYTEENVRKATLGVQGQEEARIVVVNKINFESIHDAIAYSAANGGLDAVLYADVTLESDLLVEEDVTIKIILNGHNVLNPSGYTISEKITLSGEVVDDSSVGGAIYKFFASITGNETTKDVVLYQMDDGSKLSPEKIYTLYKYENGNYNIVKTEREEELGRYTMGNSSTDMRTVRSRIYLNGITTGDYKLMDDDGLELNFSISNDGVSNNIRDNTGIAKIGTVVSGAVAKLIITIQTGGYAPRVFLVILFILIILGILYYVRNKTTSKVKE